MSVPGANTTHYGTVRFNRLDGFEPPEETRKVAGCYRENNHNDVRGMIP